MPDPLSIIRLAALLAFIGLVAVGLWLLDVAWWVVPPVMALALVIAWTIEWLAWRGTLTTSVMRETTTPGALPAPVPPPVEQAPLPVEATAPVAPAQPPPQPAPRREPQREPERPPSVAEEPPAPQPPPPPPPEPESEPEPQPPAPPEPQPQSPAPPGPPPPVAETRTPEPPSEAAPAAAAHERRPRRPRRMRLRPVPTPPPQPASVPPVPSHAESPVVAFRPRTAVPRSWNLWDLERIAREGVRAEPERRDEWAYLFLHLRQFATADGSLPAEFDGLVRESFGGLLERAPRA